MNRHHDPQQIVWQVTDEVGHMILNNPPHNRMCLAFFARLSHLARYIIPDSNVKAIVVYGMGRNFSSGAHLNDLLSAIASETKKDAMSEILEYPKSLSENIRSFSFFKQLPIPVIAAIRGVCIGSALELALCCHIRVCAKEALLGFPEATFNLMPGCGGTQRLPALIGFAKAMKMILQGETVSAEEAYHLGIVDVIVTKKDVISRAIHEAKHIATGYERKNIISS